MALSFIIFNILELFNLSLPGIVITFLFVIPALTISPLLSFLLSKYYLQTMSLVFPESLLSTSEQKYFGKETLDHSGPRSSASDSVDSPTITIPVSHWIHAIRILEFYSNRFPESVDLFLQRAAFDLDYVHDHLGANVILSQLKKMDTDFSIDQKFRIFALELEIDDLRRRQNTGMRDSDQYVQLQRSVKDAQEKLGEYLMSPRVQIDVLPKITEDIKNRKIAVETVYNRLITSYPESPEVMKTYANFCRDVLGDEELYVAYDDRADLLSAPSANDGASSSLRSASNNGSLVGRKKGGKRKKSRLQAIQSEWISLSKAEEKTSSIDGFSRGITICFIVIFVCGFLSLISTEVSLNSVSNRILVLIESSHISFQSALLPFSLRHLLYATSMGTDTASLNHLAIETSQHLNYHFQGFH
ncbi:hypothetical protein GEMRC1_005941 [Eukaryota sp. GEM-RC1]